MIAKVAGMLVLKHILCIMDILCMCVGGLWKSVYKVYTWCFMYVLYYEWIWKWRARELCYVYIYRYTKKLWQQYSKIHPEQSMLFSLILKWFMNCKDVLQQFGIGWELWDLIIFNYFNILCVWNCSTLVMSTGSWKTKCPSHWTQ